MSETGLRFPNETAEYRAKRDALQRAEIELRRRIEEVAALRRALPEGGEVPEDYVFEEGGASLDDTKTVRKVKLSELFGDKPTLVAYGFMYGPNAAKACPMCTAMLDGLNGNLPHIAQRTNLVVIAKSPIARIRAHARERGWKHLRLLSSAGNSYNRDYHTETADASQIPGMNVFVRRNGKIRHFWYPEMFRAKNESGQDPRHIDAIWPLWNVLDLTPEGRGADWRPKLTYP
jgi:predicted dithiol-disulfide oxidoreductase (DUF899 family)